MVKRSSDVIRWLGMLLWALFVNACNAWLVRPLVQDFAIFGVMAVMVLVILWWTTIPRTHRRKWVVYTLFSLLLGEGLSGLTMRSTLPAVLLGIVMVAGLSCLAWLLVRIPWRLLGATSLLLVFANVLLPVDEWPFLTHFWVSWHDTLSFQTNDMKAPPIAVLHKHSGDVVVSLENLDESDAALEKSARNATGSNDSLEDLLRNYGHRYSLVELTRENGSYHLGAMPATDMAKVSPAQLVHGFFPFLRAFWDEQAGQVVQYMAPAQSPRIMAELANQPADFPSNITALAAETRAQEQSDWHRLMTQLGVPTVESLRVEDGVLEGTYGGHPVHVAVDGTALVTTGSFTGPARHEALVSGPNLLQIVSLDDNRLVSTYHGNVANPLPNDIVTGPLDNSGIDYIFANSTPAVILRATTADGWQRPVYTAPNELLRFEASVRFQGDARPEIITDDPSQMRNSQTRYFTSYTYRDGQLIRNWRVFRANVTDVQSVRFTPDSQPQLVLSTYMSGKIFVLSRHHLPVVPMTTGALCLVMLAGWGMRWRGKGVPVNG